MPVSNTASIGWLSRSTSGPAGVRPACLDVGEVDTYFALSPRAAAWTALTAAEKDVAVNQACRWLNTLCWATELNCCDRDFAEAWEMAFSELALWLHQNPDAIIGGPAAQTQQGTFVKRQKLGDLEIEMAQLTGAAATPTTGKVSPKAPLLLQKAPLVHRHPRLLAADQLRHQPCAEQVLLTWISQVRSLPLAVELIDQVFPTPVIYQRPVAGVYDPATGTVTPAGTTDYPINAGVLSRGRMEEGGASETYELRLWVHHGAGGLPFVPETGDQVSYDGRIWRVVTIDPTYSSATLIASKITCRAA